jgi:hypothetical protein
MQVSHASPFVLNMPFMQYSVAHADMHAPLAPQSQLWTNLTRFVMPFWWSVWQQFMHPVAIAWQHVSSAHPPSPPDPLLDPLLPPLDEPLDDPLELPLLDPLLPLDDPLLDPALPLELPDEEPPSLSKPPPPLLLLQPTP